MNTLNLFMYMGSYFAYIDDEATPLRILFKADINDLFIIQESSTKHFQKHESLYYLQLLPHTTQIQNLYLFDSGRFYCRKVKQFVKTTTPSHLTLTQ